MTQTAAQGYSFSMARIARAVAAGMPHHIAQRGKRRQQTLSW